MTKKLFVDAQGPATEHLVSQLGALGYDVRRAVAGSNPTLQQIMETHPDLLVMDLASAAAMEDLERTQAGWGEGGYRDFVENSHDLICTHDMEGTLLTVNAAAEKSLGYPRDALVGRNLADLLIPEVRRFFPAYLAEVAAKGVATGVMRMRAANGEIREWEYHNTAHSSADGRRWVSGIAHDVTEQRATTRQLRASERRFRALFEQAAVGVAHIETSTGRILAANRKCAAILGYTPDELLALDFDSVLHPEDRVAQCESVSRLERGEVPEFMAECRLLRKDGAPIWVELSVSPMWRPGRAPTEHMAVLQDITERRRAEVQRVALEAQLRHAQKLEAVGTLAGGIAHDFNNLLAVIRGNTELARLDLDPQHPALLSIDAISAAASRATELVRQILAFSRKQRSQRVPLYLGPVVEEAVRLLRAALPARIHLEAHLDTFAPAVLADATQIHQIVMNLCTNAWHAIEPGFGSIDLSLDAVMISSAPPGEEGVTPGLHARITVRDDGVGMGRETLERIFEPFFTTRGVGHGSGLGLSVAHGIVKEHGGMIAVESRPGEGSTFYVYLPAVEAPVRAPGQLEPPVAPVEARPAEALGRVLYVDDEPAVVDFVTRLIERLGYRATSFLRGSDAVEAVRADPARFDAVITDYTMPAMSGIDVAREVARIRPDLPVVLVSGYAELPDDHLAAPGIRHRLNKPFGRAELAELLQRVVRRGAGAAT